MVYWISVLISRHNLHGNIDVYVESSEFLYAVFPGIFDLAAEMQLPAITLSNRQSGGPPHETANVAARSNAVSTQPIPIERPPSLF